MKCSIVIVTYKRNADLLMCLSSIMKQSFLPSDIVIVDNALDRITGECVQARVDEFKKVGIELRYIGNSINSLTVARNVGAKMTIGDVIFFLDDDVILDKEYIKEVLSVYEGNSKAVGVQGFIDPGPVDRKREVLSRIFYWYHLESGGGRVLPSVSATYPAKLDAIEKCQWLSGANHSYRRHILDEFQYDNKLVKYSDGEDLEFSYRVFKRYPGSLFITPFAKLIHNTSNQGRALGKELIYMREIYGLYLFNKLFEQNVFNILKYTWSRIGRLCFTAGRVILKRQFDVLLEMKYLIGAYYACIMKCSRIRSGNLDFFNASIV